MCCSGAAPGAAQEPRAGSAHGGRHGEGAEVRARLFREYAAGDRGSNVTRSAAESGEAAWAEARTAVAEGAFHRTGSAAAVTAANVAAETGADERPPIAVSARNFKHSQTKKRVMTYMP